MTSDGRRRPDWPSVLGNWVLTLVIVGGLAWVWSTSRGATEAFPGSLLQASGLLLTALVFVLGLGQNGLRRTADSLLLEARRWEEQYVKAYVDRPAAVTTVDVWQRASVTSWAELEVDRPRTAREARLTLRQARTLTTPWGPEGFLDRRLSIGAIQRELARVGDEAPSPRRRRYLEREEARLRADDADAVAALKRAGHQETGLKRVYARYLVAELSLRNLVSTAWVFIVMMLALLVAGVIYAGWNPTQAPPPDLWAGIVLLTLAGAYAIIIREDISLGTAELSRALRHDSWLLAMNDAENHFGRAENDSDPDLGAMYRRETEAALDRAGASAPGMPWQASLRGRQHLAKALQLQRIRNFSDRFGTELRQHVTAASRLLDYATSRGDDPIAALASARLHEVRAQLAEQDGRPADALWERADELVEAALEMLENAYQEPIAMGSQPHHRWIREQQFIWPHDDGSIARLRTATWWGRDEESTVAAD